MNWQHKGAILNKNKINEPVTDSLKLTLSGDKIIAFGYAFDRSDTEKTIGNAETNGLLDSDMYFIESKDTGNTWSDPIFISNSFNDPVEASCPLLVLSNGHWVTPIANFYNWKGVSNTGLHGRLLRSENEGKTWNDDTITMEFEGRETAIWEQRVCELEPGVLVVLAWNEDLRNNKALPNHFTVSKDYGKTFDLRQSTGIMGQASNLIYIGNNKVLSVHCIRRDTDRPGIYGYIADLSKGRWEILEEKVLWEPSIPIKADKSMMDVFAYLKFWTAISCTDR